MRESALEAEQSIMDLQALKARCLGNLNLMERVLSKFSGQLVSDVEALEVAFEAGDTESFAQVAHRIKGMSANVEAHSLYATAVAAEHSARHKHTAELPAQLQQIQRDRDRLVSSLSAVLDSRD